MNTEVIKTNIDDVLIFRPEPFLDHRGYLFESFNKSFYEKHLPRVDFVQDNESKSNFGILRGFHFQSPPYEQAKLVRVIQGEIQDVALDIREESKTYLEYVSVILSDKNRKQLYIPRGFAHAFLVLSKQAVVSYKIDNIFNENSYSGIRYDDPSLDIEWKIEKDKIVVSDKDSNHPYINT